MKFKENFKNYRIEKGITQKEIANSLNTTLKTISHWETGYTEPSISQLVEIAKFFNVSIDELVN